MVFVYRLSSSLDCGLCCGFSLITVVGCALLGSALVTSCVFVCLLVYG